jgi:hypothetical protein
MAETTSMALPGYQAAVASEVLRKLRRRRPSYSGRLAQVLFLPEGVVATADSLLSRTRARRIFITVAEPEEPQLPRQRAVREAVMLLPRLRRRAVPAAMGARIQALAATPTPVARPARRVLATHRRPRTRPAGRREAASTSILGEATPPRWPMRRRSAAERRLPRRLRQSQSSSASCKPRPVQRRTP